MVPQHRIRHGDRAERKPPFAVVGQIPQRHLARGQLVGTDDGGEGCALRVGVAHLRLQAATGCAHEHLQPRRPRRRAPVSGPPAPPQASGARCTARAAPTPAPQSPCRLMLMIRRSNPRAEADARRRRPAKQLDEAVVAAAAAQAALRRPLRAGGTPTRCACSSRARERAARRCVYVMSSTSRYSCSCAKCSRHGIAEVLLQARRIGDRGLAASPPCSPAGAADSSRTARGSRRTASAAAAGSSRAAPRRTPGGSPASPIVLSLIVKSREAQLAVERRQEVDHLGVDERVRRRLRPRRPTGCAGGSGPPAGGRSGSSGRCRTAAPAAAGSPCRARCTPASRWRCLRAAAPAGRRRDPRRGRPPSRRCRCSRRTSAGRRPRARRSGFRCAGIRRARTRVRPCRGRSSSTASPPAGRRRCRGARRTSGASRAGGLVMMPGRIPVESGLGEPICTMQCRRTDVQAYVRA